MKEDKRNKEDDDKKEINLPVRKDVIRLEKTEDGEINAFFPSHKKKLSLKVFFDGKYSHIIMIKPYTENCYIENLDNVRNVRVKLYQRKKLISTSNTITLENKIENKQPRLNKTVKGYLSYNNPWKLYKFDMVKSAVTITLSRSSYFSDFDLYANWDNTKTWKFFSKKWGNDEAIDIPKPETERTLYVLVYRYYGSGEYNLQVTINDPEPSINTPSVTWSGTSKKMALLSGISDYKDISDLSYCDEDVVDWYNYLTSQGYECRVLGDNHPTNFPRYDGLATKSTIRSAVQTLVSTAKPGDTIAFISSGHGASSNIEKGDSFLCTYEGAEYTDYELHDDMAGFDGNKIVIIDHCFSGGFGDNLGTLSNMFFSATCTQAGYGYDVAADDDKDGVPGDDGDGNGAFTYAWQEVLLTNEPNTLPNLFQMVKERYNISQSAADQPVSVCTNDSICF